jgi:hypothetical protein
VTVVSFLLAAGRKLTVAVLWLWLSLPMALVCLLAVRRSLYLDRTFLDATFPLYLILGLAVTVLVRWVRRTAAEWRGSVAAQAPHALGGVLGTVLAIFMAAASFAGLRPVYAGDINPDWQSLARDFRPSYRPGQAVVFNPGVLRSLLASYLPSGWHATYERPIWSRSYIDVPGWQDRYSFPSHPDKPERQREEAILRDDQLAEAARHAHQIWLITFDYSGMNDTRRWFSEHGFQCLISELYRGDTRLELWSRAGPSSFGATVVSPGFEGWRETGHVRLAAGVAETSGHSALARSFDTIPGHAYSVSVTYRGIPLASRPDITVQMYDRSGHLLDLFPRTMWYDWPVNGVWLTQPFGFVAPPGATRAVLTVGNRWGVSEWRDVAVYQGR